MLQTRVGKRTGAAALKMAVDMTKQRALEDQPGGGGHARHRRAPRPGAAPAVRRHRPRRARQGPGRVARRRRRQGLLHRRRRRRRRRAGREGHPRAQRDQPRRRARHDGLPRASSPPAAASSATPPSSPAAGARRPSSAPRRSGSTARSFTVGGVAVNEGDVISLDGTTGRGRARRDEARPRPSRRPSSTPSSSGPTRSARASSPCGPTPTPATTPPTPASFGAEGIGLCRTEHMFLAEDRLPVVRRMILADTPAEEEAPRSRSCGVVQKTDFEEILEAMDGLPVTVRLLDPPLHEFLPSIEELRASRRPPTGSSTAEEQAAGGGRAVGRAQPDDRHPRRAPRRRQARPLRHAGAGADGGRGRAVLAKGQARSSRS